MVDRSGITFLFRTNEETGASVPDISGAWLVAREVFDMAGFWAQVEALDGQVDVATQIALLLEGRKLVERAARWLLHNRRPPFDIRATIEFFSAGMDAIGGGLPKLLAGRDLAGFTERQEAFIARDVPVTLAERVAAMVPAYSAFDVVEIAAATGREIEETAEVYFDLADRLQIARLRDQIVALPRDDRWNTMARGALRDDLYAAHAALARDVLMVTGPGDSRAAAGGMGGPQRAGGAAGDADPDRNLAERPVHGRHLVGGGPGHPHPGRGGHAAGASVMRTRPPDRAVNGVIVRSDLPARVGFPA